MNTLTPMKKEKKPSKITKTWIFSYFFHPLTEQIVRDETREILFKGFMTASEGHFLEDLKVNKILLNNGIHAYNWNPS